MKRGLLFILLCFALFSLTLGCKPSEAQIREAILETEIVQAGATLTEQAKATATYTITPTTTPTRTPTPTKTLTPTTTLKPALATSTAIQSTKDYKSTFGKIAWRELKNYPDNHKLERIKIQGKIFQIIQAIDMLLWYPGTYDAFYVSFDENYSGVYEDDTITIFGTVEGSYCYDTQAGGTNCVPKINGLWFEE